VFTGTHMKQRTGYISEIDFTVLDLNLLSRWSRRGLRSERNHLGNGGIVEDFSEYRWVLVLVGCRTHAFATIYHVWPTACYFRRHDSHV
jgi:hypothetical protein